MAIVCARCKRRLPSSEDPPSFCAYCGQRLGDCSPEITPPLNDADGNTVPHIIEPTTAVEPELPEQIGGYRLLRLLGAGGMGRVYEAEGISSGHRVALKLLSARLSQNPVSVERFRQEGRLASQINHPRCVFVLGADTDKHQPYIVMELMPGQTLRDLLNRRGMLPPEEAIPLILDVIEGLLEAHRLGVIHRDVKPSNCFLMPDGHVKIGDFGLSKSLGSDRQLTQSGAFLGTVLYASPEQIKGEPVDYASDVYSVTATLFELLAGKPPFEHENVTAALAKIISEDAPDIRMLQPSIPRTLAKVVEKGLQRDRSRRYANLEELRDALIALLPSRLSYGGLTIRIGAYLLDEVFVRLLLILPITGLIRLSTGPSLFTAYLSLIVFPLYFAILEGLTGASLGKRLLHLRVCRLGSTDIPGLRRAIVRTLAFYLLVTLTLMPMRIAIESGQATLTSILFSLVPFVLGLLVLIVPMRKANNFRGMHEMLSGTCVLRLPQKRPALKLRPRRPNPLESLPPRGDQLPANIGPYVIKAAAQIDEHLWIARAEDPVLARWIVLRIRTTFAGSVPRNQAINRPTRLRLIHHGDVMVLNHRAHWEAYVAPEGAPLRELIDPSQPLPWRAARQLLEQLSEEIIQAEQENSLPELLTLDQIWVAPNGRLQLLDFPIPRLTEATMPVETSPASLLRTAAIVALEGKPRLGSDAASSQIRAPIPMYAQEMLLALATSDPGKEGVASLKMALERTRDLPPDVEPRMRLGQLLIQAGTLAIGLVLMFGVSGLFAAFHLLKLDRNIAHGQELLSRLRSTAEKQQLIATGLIPDDPATIAEIREKLQTYLQQQRQETTRLEPALSAVERIVFSEMTRNPYEPNDGDLKHILEQIHRPDEAIPTEPFAGWREASFLILLWPFLWMAGSALFRGGISYYILGIGIMRLNGIPATRAVCAWRTAFVWFPIAGLLCAAIWIQVHIPQMVVLHSVLWLTAFALLPLYFAIAVTSPDRGPHDRLIGTRLVPR